MKRLLTALGLLTFLTTVAAAADSATVLARILAAKGAITAPELTRVEQAAVTDRVSVLAAILQQKGLLTGTEVAAVRGEVGGLPRRRSNQRCTAPILPLRSLQPRVRRQR